MIDLDFDVSDAPIGHRKRGRFFLQKCKKGHPFTLKNTYWHKSSQPNKMTRQCRTCMAENAKRRASHKP